MTTGKNWFSNFLPLDEPMQFKGGLSFTTVENFYQAMKTLDESDRSKIAVMSAGESKRYGKRVKLRADWDERKLDVMEYALRKKFAPGTSWHRKLMAAVGEIVEWNYWHDNYWGNCTCSRCKGKPGENHLGRLLMKIRTEFNELPF